MTELSGIHLDAIRVLDVYCFTGPAQRVLSRQRRPYAQLLVVVGGVYKATVDTVRGRQHVRAEAGDVVCWPAGSEDTDESEAGKPLRCISVEFLWPGMPAQLPFLVRDTDHLIDLLANRLVTLAHDPTRTSELGAEVTAFLAALLAEFVLRARTAGDEIPARVARYTEEHIHEPIRLADLARCAGLEMNHFCRKYKQLTGRTPMQDVKRRKAAYAKHVLLSNPRWTLCSVLSLVGVKDTATLSRLLTRHAGASARDIKKAARKR